MNGKWHYGSLIQLGNDWCQIIPTKEHDDGIPIESIRVVSDSIGQFTGLKDKIGKEIYEGDVIKHDLGISEWVGKKWIVSFDMGAFQLITKGETAPLSFVYHAFAAIDNGVIDSWDEYESHLEVIGNIYENPELLK